MSLAPLMELLKTHRRSPDECARRLVAWADGRPTGDNARALRTALAVGTLDDALSRQILAALAGATPPAAAAGPPEDEEDETSRDLEQKVSRLEASQEGLVRDLAEARRLETEIAGGEEEIAGLADVLGALREDVAARRDRCAAKRALLEEVGQ